MYVGLAVGFGILITITILIIIFAHELVKYVPFSAEERFVRPYERLLTKGQSKERSERKIAIQSYLENLVDDLAGSDDLSDKVTFKIHYSDDYVQNAFATLGGI